MTKSILIILMTTLLSGSSIALGQESYLNSQYINHSETCSANAMTQGRKISIAAKELSSEELDRIVGEGFGSFLTPDENQTGYLATIILWDEALKKGNACLSDGIELTTGGCSMHGVRVNGIIR